MTKEKELSMNQTFRQFMDAGLGLGSADVLNDIVNEKMMGFGTTIDEKIFNLDELKALIARQKEQSKDIDLNWEIKPLSHYTSTDENTAFFADELLLHATVGGESIEMYLRFSVVLSYVNSEWKVIHWHGSKPENVQSEKDTWGIETWKEKAEALEKLVEERTIDLAAKNRELEIQASLEKVRGVAMSMSKPNDLLSVCEVLFSQLYKIGFKEIRCAHIHIFKDERGYFDDYDYSDFTGGKISAIPYKGNKVVEDFLMGIRKSEDSFAEVVVKGEELAEFISFRKKTGQVDDPRLLNAAEISYYFYSVGSGNIGISNFGKIEDAQLLILKRFRNVFQLAYQRFADISLAEAQAKESQIQLALERVRARTMAMQKSDELLEVVATLYEQLGLLHFDSNACNIIIIDEESNNQQYWVSGFTQKLFPECYNVSYFKHPYIDLQLQSWKEGLKYIVIEYAGDAKKEFDKKFFSQTDFKKVPEEVQKVIKSLESVKLSTAFFTYGALQIVSPDSLNEEKAGILQRFANVFDQTYTRFLDLQKAEALATQAEQDVLEIKAAKQKAEKAFVELQATQKQLIQSEKMASLGELTAGIAHEIQNPLNFVNNFSEVSKELLDEMKLALDNGDEDEAKEIAGDIIQNLEKITHHGKRADAIVKGMLQHSRASSNQKEVTDINALADEYLRLAYHGLRAKDKSFNATLKTDFDANITAVTLVPQDFGRAILNIISNAFHAVNEKKKSSTENFEPVVSVSTKMFVDKIELCVADNGNGIPKDIIDKIFQPFFTTKPTGQGTGLGLSMSYDIITKGHNGVLKVESTAGKGSQFIIQLPTGNTHENISSR